MNRRRSMSVVAEPSPADPSAWAWGSVPWVTIVIAVACLSLWPMSGISSALEYQRDAIQGGAWWRIFTGHLVHFSGDHLFWSIAVFGVIGAMLERESRPRYLAVLLGSAAATSLAVLGLETDLQVYRGLSGIDSALFVALAAWRLTAPGVANRERSAGSGERALIILKLVGFVGKTAFETFAGKPVFVGGEAIGFDPVPLAHLVGAIVGGLLALVRRSTPGSRDAFVRCDGLRLT